MRADKKAERDRAKLAALLGMTVPEPPKPRDVISEQNASREAEAAGLYLEEPKRFITRACKICTFTFAVDRMNISCCSDTCRKKNLEGYGIIWDASARTIADRWSRATGGPEPLIVEPHLLPMIQEVRQQIETDSLSQALQLAEQSVDDLLAGLDL